MVNYNDTTSKMWREDREGFRKSSFALDGSMFEGDERTLTHYAYYDLFAEHLK